MPSFRSLFPMSWPLSRQLLARQRLYIFGQAISTHHSFAAASPIFLIHSPSPHSVMAEGSKAPTPNTSSNSSGDDNNHGSSTATVERIQAIYNAARDAARRNPGSPKNLPSLPNTFN